jgi:chemotaxis signal transduction protein
MMLNASSTPVVAMISVLLLRVSGQTLALRQDDVAEILPLPRLVAVPEAPAIVRGAFHLGPELVLVMRLAALLGLVGAPEGDPLYHHLVLLTRARGQARLALLVDRVTDVVRAAPALLPSGHSFNDCVAGDIRVADAPVPLLSAQRLLTARETALLAAFAARAAARETAVS